MLTFLRPRGPICPLAFLAAFSLVGCSDDEDPWFLGPVDAAAASIPDAPAPTDAPLPVLSLSMHECQAATPIVGPDLLSTIHHLASLGGRALVTTGEDIRALQLDSSGCPGVPISSFGTNGSLTLDALAAVPLPANRSIVATGTATLVLDSTGQSTASCDTEGQLFPSRVLDANGQGSVLAAFSKSPMGRLSTDLATPTACNLSLLDLEPSPSTILAITHAATGNDFLAVQQSSPKAPLKVVRYDETGKLTAELGGTANALDPSHLCSASAIIDTALGPMVADPACQRIVRFGPTALAELKTNGEPRGLTAVLDGTKALATLVRPLSEGAIATYITIELR